MNVQNSLCPPTQNFQMHFRKPHEEFLGIIISQRRVEMDPKKLNTIQSRSSPTSVKTIWSFTVWLISTESSNLTSPPLLRLSTFWPERMNSPWIWTQLQQKLQIPHVSCPFTIQTLLFLQQAQCSCNRKSMVIFTLAHISPRCSRLQNETVTAMTKNSLPSSSPSINGVSTFGVPHTLSPLSHITKTSHRLRISENYPINKLVGHCFYRTLTSCLDGPQPIPRPLRSHKDLVDTADDTIVPDP